MKKLCLCLLGDSICKGVVFDQQRNRYVHEKASFGELLQSGGAVEVQNFSKFGCTVTKGQTIARRNFEAIASAECTILEFGGNDSDHNWAAIAQDPEKDHRPNTSIGEFRSQYRQLVLQLKGAGKAVAMMTLPPIDAEKYFAWFTRGLDRQNILRWLGGSVEYVYRWHEIYNQQICDLANELQVPLIDIRSAFLYDRNYSELLCVDGIHPNAKGHRLVFDVLQPVLQSIGTPACA